MTGPHDRFCTARGLRFHYREWGASDRPTVLVHHGITGHAREMDGLASALADAYRVLAIDARGHGESSWADAYAPRIMADDVAAIMAELGIAWARVVGISMGGVNAWYLASRHPRRVERLAIVDIDPATVTSLAAYEGLAAHLAGHAGASFGDPDQAVDRYLAGRSGDHREELRAFVLANLVQGNDRRWRWRFDANGLASWNASAFEDAEAHREAVHSVATPTLVIRGGTSSLTTRASSEALVRDLPRARLVEIPGVGHDVHIGRRDELATALKAFFGEG